MNVGRETLHVHSEAVHVHVHEDANGTRPRDAGCFREDDIGYGYGNENGNENGNDGRSGQQAGTVNPSCLGALVVQLPSLIYHKDTKTPRMRGTQRARPGICSEFRLQAVFLPPPRAARHSRVAVGGICRIAQIIGLTRPLTLTL